MSFQTFHLDLFKHSFLERWERFDLTTRIIFIIIITWFPLVIMSWTHETDIFLRDITTHAKFLIALPFLIFAPATIKEDLRNIIYHFVKSGIIKDEDQDKFYSLVHSTQSLKNSHTTLSIIWLIVYGSVIVVATHVEVPPASSWRISSFAGLWFSYISQPIYTFVQLHFIFNAILWWRLVFKISRFDLQLKASHGDDTGGLIFLADSVKVFYIPVMAFSCSVAVGALNLVLNRHFNIFDLKLSVMVLILLCSFLFVTPLLFYFRPLSKIRREAILLYSTLGGRQLEEFEKKWLIKGEKHDETLIDSPEFSNVADTTSIINRTSQMRVVPMTKGIFLGLIIAILIPFIPVISLKISWKDILKQAMALMM